MPVGTPFEPGKSGTAAGRTPGVPNLATRIRRIMEGDEPLPKVISETIERSVGDKSKKPIDAVIIVALLQTLQADKQWADWLSQNGYGKPVETLKHKATGESNCARWHAQGRAGEGEVKHG